MVKTLKKIKQNFNSIIKHSFFMNKIKENKSIILCSLILAILCTLITYPGVFYTDSYDRITLSNLLIKNIKLYFSEGTYNSISSWLTPIPSLFIAICKCLTGNIATYTLVQSMCFFLVTFLLIKRLNPKYRKFTYFVFAFSPLIYCVSIFYEASIGCLIGIVAFILLLDTAKVQKNRLDHIIEFMCCVLFSFIIFGYRANAFTILPVLLFYVFRIGLDKKIKSVFIVGIVLGLFLVYLTPKIFKINTMSSMSAGFMWEIVSILKKLPEVKQVEYDQYLDEINDVEIETTKNCILAEDGKSVNPLLSDKCLGRSDLSNNGHPQLIMSKYMNLIVKEPFTFFQVKWDFAKKTLGISRPISDAEYNYNRNNLMKSYNFSDSQERVNFVNSYHNFHKVFGFYTRHPWFVFIISIIFVIYKFKKKDKNKSIYALMLFLSIFYYGAYLINTQSFEIRYFYPSLYLCTIMNVVITFDLFSDVKTKAKKVIDKKNFKGNFIHQFFNQK